MKTMKTMIDMSAIPLRQPGSETRTLPGFHFAKIATASACCALIGALAANAEQQVSVQYAMPMKVNAKVDSSECSNAQGPYITLSGEISLGGLTTQILLENNLNGTKSTTVLWVADVSLINFGAPISIPKQPVRGGVGGNPLIYLQFVDGKGNNLTDEFYLGRCVQGLSVTPELVNQAAAVATVATAGCNNKGGPTITLGGEITLSGLTARFIFRNNVKGTHTAESIQDVAIILEGSKITVPKSPHQGGAGGNPIIGIQFLNGDRTPINDPVILGRCNKL